MERHQVLELMNGILAKQGKTAATDEKAELRAIGFRSLDFSELALRVEMQLGEELTFDAAALRRIHTVADVLDFFANVARG